MKRKGQGRNYNDEPEYLILGVKGEENEKGKDQNTLGPDGGHRTVEIDTRGVFRKAYTEGPELQCLKLRWGRGWCL